MTVRQGFLRPVTRRLNEAERTACIQSGSVFVWEECNDEMGLKRWTGEHHHVLAQSIADVFLDGRIWGQSRMREVSPKTTQASCLFIFSSRTCSMTKNYLLMTLLRQITSLWRPM
jgi:hypothetical protein